MKIGKYISELLFENEFVILPEVGEFSTKYIPAKFIPELRKVESPSKVITFSERNKTGGGMLADYVAKKESIGQAEARQFIDSFVSEMQNSLKSGRKVELESIGVFSLDSGGSLVFEPDTTINYLIDSTGVKRVSEPAKKTEEEAKTELDKAIEGSLAATTASKDQKSKSESTTIADKATHEPIVSPSQGIKPKTPVIPTREPITSLGDKYETLYNPPARKAGLSAGMKWTAFLIVPLIVIIIILAFNYDYILGEKSLFRAADAPITAPVVTQPADEMAADPAGDAAQAAAQLPFDPTAPPALPEGVRPVFYIVVGSFEEEHSAVILAEQLREAGARTANVFPINREGFFRVYYGFYYNLSEAEGILPQVQAQFPNAWILHR